MSTAGNANDPTDAQYLERFKRIANACAQGDLASVRDDLNGRGDPVLFMTDEWRSSLLHFAVIGGNPDVLPLLIDLGADLEASTTMDLGENVPKGSKTALDLARITGKNKVIAILEAACEAAGLAGETSEVKVMRYPDGGLFVGVYNAYTGDRVHPKLAQWRRKRVEALDVPMESVGDLDGIGAIVAAVETDDTAQLERAIDGYPAGDQILVGGGNTVLHLAAMSGNLENVILLLKKGADPFLRNEQGQRPIDMVPDRGVHLTRHLLALVMGEDRPYLLDDDGTVREPLKELLHRKAAKEGIPLDAIAALKAKHENADR